ncbi:Tfp pilus assembly protein PilF [Archangium gephyra]|uniref:Tfp pilus assembly protein PilF n=1 Tax=Archangium gephyra TaxID=48 RepID=A0ABX9JNL0_9BACT|nr:tetratricopeptide repeat protein [Archangium gephyra]REG23175.1 Tfp pilus assembly protein PilF [Archangium gephyra]
MSAERLLALVCLLLIAACDSKSSNKEVKKPVEEISAVYRGGAVEEAEKRLRAHLQAEPRDDLAWTLLGHVLLDLNRPTEAEAAYAKALELEPRRIEAITGQGRIFRMHKEYEQAMAAYQRATAIDPSYAQAWSSMMVVALKRGLYDEAIAHGEKAYALDKNDPTIAANLAIAYHYAGNTAKRDELTQVAQKLGFKGMDWLDKVYTGQIEVRD